MTDIGPNPFNDDGTPKLDNDRKMLIFAVARELKKSCYSLGAVWFTDAQRWGLVCKAKIDGVVYQSCNFLDDFEPKDHADLFRMAFSNALKEVEAKKKNEVLIH